MLKKLPDWYSEASLTNAPSRLYWYNALIFFAQNFWDPKGICYFLWFFHVWIWYFLLFNGALLKWHPTLLLPKYFFLNALNRASAKQTSFFSCTSLSMLCGDNSAHTFIKNRDLGEHDVLLHCIEVDQDICSSLRWVRPSESQKAMRRLDYDYDADNARNHH